MMFRFMSKRGFLTFGKNRKNMYHISVSPKTMWNNPVPKKIHVQKECSIDVNLPREKGKKWIIIFEVMSYNCHTF